MSKEDHEPPPCDECGGDVWSGHEQNCTQADDETMNNDGLHAISLSRRPDRGWIAFALCDGQIHLMSRDTAQGALAAVLAATLAPTQRETP